MENIYCEKSYAWIKKSQWNKHCNSIFLSAFCSSFSTHLVCHFVRNRSMCTKFFNLIFLKKSGWLVYLFLIELVLIDFYPPELLTDIFFNYYFKIISSNNQPMRLFLSSAFTSNLWRYLLFIIQSWHLSQASCSLNDHQWGHWCCTC